MCALGVDVALSPTFSGDERSGLSSNELLAAAASSVSAVTTASPTVASNVHGDRDVYGRIGNDRISPPLAPSTVAGESNKHRQGGGAERSPGVTGSISGAVPVRNGSWEGHGYPTSGAFAGGEQWQGRREAPPQRGGDSSVVSPPAQGHLAQESALSLVLAFLARVMAPGVHESFAMNAGGTWPENVCGWFIAFSLRAYVAPTGGGVGRGSGVEQTEHGG